MLFFLVRPLLIHNGHLDRLTSIHVLSKVEMVRFWVKAFVVLCYFFVLVHVVCLDLSGTLVCYLCAALVLPVCVRLRCIRAIWNNCRT